MADGYHTIQACTGLVCYSGFAAEVAELPCKAHNSAGFVFNAHHVCHADVLQVSSLMHS